MDISDFDYPLPPERIARTPAMPRDASRMMVLDASRRITDSQFRRLPDFLNPSDVLVLNDTRVIRARTRARLERRGGTSRDIEIFFAEPVGDNTWQVLCKPGRRIRPGDHAIFGGGEFRGIFQDSLGADLHVLELPLADRVLELYGQIPLPPYIDRAPSPEDVTSYQTVFAAQDGAVAAPTAGLHFTEESLHALRDRGIAIATVTLHVGIGTFLPVRTQDPAKHTLRPERFHVSTEGADLLESARRQNRRIISVGTTTTRTLEFLMQKHGEIRAGSGATDLYILPGFEFRVVRGLLTNFHLPRSTLLMLVSAFAGRETILAAYLHAIEQNYRFYSYGDCMLILASRQLST